MKALFFEEMKNKDLIEKNEQEILVREKRKEDSRAPKVEGGEGHPCPQKSGKKHGNVNISIDLGEKIAPSSAKIQWLEKGNVGMDRNGKKKERVFLHSWKIKCEPGEGIRNL